MKLKVISLTIILLVVVLFFWKFFLQGLIPLPGDTVLGMYLPWKDVVWEREIAGYPVRNFLLTDPVRQNYPWKIFMVESIKSGQIPLWNPFNFSGGPFLANFQSAVFYPLNFLFLIFPLSLAWSIFIIFQHFLAAVFTFLFLRNLKLSNLASVFGGLVFAFSGFMISWSEWGTLGHVALWLPLALLSTDKLLLQFHSKWFFLLNIVLILQLFAGHFQISFYLYVMVIIYLFARIWLQKKIDKGAVGVIIAITFSLLISAIQLLPTLELASLSSRLDYYGQGQRVDFYLPFKHLAMFLAPDFFGTPAKLNYWGDFNYIEFNGYIGSLALFLGVLAGLFRRDKKTIFFSVSALIFLSFALPTPWAKIPYLLNIPLYKTLAPTRLMFLIDFSLAVLAALGLDWLTKNRINFKQIAYFFGVSLSGYILLWLFIALNVVYLSYPWSHQLEITARNLLIPFVVFTLGGIISIIYVGFRQFKFRHFLSYGLVLLAIFDLFWLQQEYTPFIKKELIFPTTPTIEFLQKQTKPFRVLITDQLIIPAGFNIVYGLESLDGYDSLYSKRYNELVSMGQRNYFADKKNIFGRIIYLNNINSSIFDMLGGKFILSKIPLDNPKLKMVFKEGNLYTYENLKSAPRAFWVSKWEIINNDDQILQRLLDKNFDFRQSVILEEKPEIKMENSSDGEKIVTINKLTPNELTIQTKTDNDQIVVVSQSYFPGWKAKIDGQNTPVLRANYGIIAIPVKSGNHRIDLYYDPTSFRIGLVVSFIGIGALLVFSIFLCKINE